MFQKHITLPQILYMYIYHLQNCSLFVLIFLDVLYLCIVFILGEKKKWTSEEKSLKKPLVSRAVRIGGHQQSRKGSSIPDEPAWIEGWPGHDAIHSIQ